MDQEKNKNDTIDKFMCEYLQNKEDIKKESAKEDLIVNFDISYAEGKSESFVCGSESDVFGNYHEENVDDIEENKDDDIKFYYSENDYDYESKWTNCEDEITEKLKENHDEIKMKKQVNGEIVVYSTLKTIDGTRIKGVKINLYRINGISPELVESLETDCNGKVVFQNVSEGNYRVIEIIDKRYFNKPNYVNWNEVSVDCNNEKFVIYAVNTISERCGIGRR